MPKIEIETFLPDPNYCAVEAVAKAMKDNYTNRKTRSYQHKSVITVDNGMTLIVVEDGSVSALEEPGTYKFKVWV